MKNLMKKSKKGFTLMEMLIVVAIIAILVVIAIPTFTNALDNARANTDLANTRAWYAEEVVKAMLAGGTVSTTAGEYDDATPWGGTFESDNSEVTVSVNNNVLTVVFTNGSTTETFGG